MGIARKGGWGCKGLPGWLGHFFPTLQILKTHSTETSVLSYWHLCTHKTMKRHCMYPTTPLAPPHMKQSVNCPCYSSDFWQQALCTQGALHTQAGTQVNLCEAHNKHREGIGICKGVSTWVSMGQPAEKNHQENCQVRDCINAKLPPRYAQMWSSRSLKNMMGQFPKIHPIW